ncbi:MAG TPA: hypothetical protein VGN91_03030 [Bosea sp. (in: a-proteobacteria)]|jgi:hypothetical protein|nr:hypothetical protein [Bosea sp. (in: a-proteobacteria)]
MPDTKGPAANRSSSWPWLMATTNACVALLATNPTGSWSSTTDLAANGASGTADPAVIAGCFGQGMNDA